MEDQQAFQPVIGQNPPDGKPFWLRTQKKPHITVSFWPLKRHILEDDREVIANEFRLHKIHSRTKEDIVLAGLIGVKIDEDNNPVGLELVALRPTTTEKQIKPYVDTIVDMYRHMAKLMVQANVEEKL